MKQIFLFGVLLILKTGFSHPGIGIVKDSKGNIYYTDLEKVWKIHADGKRSVIVRNVHTHELFMDGNDDLFGEHSWYNGEDKNTWGHYVWCLRHTGKLDTVIKPSPGFLEGYSFVRDSAGNMYWAERGDISRIQKRAKNGTVGTLASGKFTDIRWMYATKAGDVYFIDLDDLYKVDKKGNCRLLAKSISRNTAPFGIYSGKHSIFGIWDDQQGNVYFASFSGQVVKRFTPQGKIENVVYSRSPWSPTGGVFDNYGNMWLLECSITNTIRARRIALNDLRGVLVKNEGFNKNVLTAVLALGVLGVIVKLTGHAKRLHQKPLS